jgi:hypothetical protein
VCHFALALHVYRRRKRARDGQRLDKALYGRTTLRAWEEIAVVAIMFLRGARQRRVKVGMDGRRLGEFNVNFCGAESRNLIPVHLISAGASDIEADMIVL